MSIKPVKLLIADDHALFRDALVLYITRANPEADVTVFRDLYGVEVFLKKGEKADLVILDLKMPGMNGLEGFARLRKSFPHVPLALMSGVVEEEEVRLIMQMGACAYFPKTLPGRDLIKGINMVLNGHIFLPMEEGNVVPMRSYNEDRPNKGNARINSRTQNADDGDADIHETWLAYREITATGKRGRRRTGLLTAREHEVASCLVEGCSNKIIADRLGLQIVTVKLHVRSIFKKLNVKNRTQAALLLHESGLLESKK
ncbi:MAG: response regulator [Pseudobdellovibrionaceae bacterium]